MQQQFKSDLDRRAYAIQMRAYHFPNVTPQIETAVSEPLYRPFVASKLSKLPSDFHQRILSEYADRSPDGANPNANIWLRESIDETCSSAGLPLTADDEEISRYADNKAKMIKDFLASQIVTTPESITLLIDQICQNSGINSPHQKTLLSKIQRACDAGWWRKRLRKQLMQTREAGAIKMGLVHSREGLYISNHALERRRQSDKRSREWLQGIEMVNEDGEAIALEDIFNSGVSNPKNRFVEMVTRIKGFEEYGLALAYKALFTTTTCPSRMHARKKALEKAMPNTMAQHQKRLINTFVGNGQKQEQLLSVRV